MAGDSSSSANLTNLYTHLQTLIKKWVYDKPEVDNKLSDKENTSNKTTQWSNNPDDNKYPSEKLVKDSLDNKASIGDLNNGLQNIGAYTIHTVYNVSGTASAFNISSGLLYAQQAPVFFLVKNTIGDNEANATLKYYPNGDNITIMDTFSSNYSPIQQGVWKKDTWGLFFCQGNSIVQLKCIFYDGVDINKIKNILGMDNLPYYVVLSVSTDKRVTYNVDDNNGVYDGNSFYLKVPYYETSTDKNVTLKTPTGAIKQGSNFVTESQVNGHLLKLRFNSGIFELLEIYDNDKLIPLFSDLSTVAETGSYNDLSDKPTIPSVPSASSVTPSADTTSGSVGNGTTWARSNHTHPKSSLYAEASHTHSEYVNPTIIDNLTTDDATKVLSAKQGKVLNDLIGDAIDYINQ